MKSVKSLLLMGCLLAASHVHAQMAVIDAGVATILSMTKADQAIYYAQSIIEQINAAQNSYNQFMNMLRAEQRALSNLKNVTTVRNFDDFMKWNNRQLYLENQAESRFRNMGIAIGGQTYRMADIEKIPGALIENFDDEYRNDFSEAQRKEMWTRLGLTPSNYVYVKAWQAREEAIAARMMTLSDTINEDNMRAYEKWKTLSDEYYADKNKPEDEKMQEKRILTDIAAILMDTNILQRSMAYDRAQERELDEARRKQAQAPATSPALSDTYHADPYISITAD
jgi:hypothetical protein